MAIHKIIPLALYLMSVAVIFIFSAFTKPKESTMWVIKALSASLIAAATWETAAIFGLGPTTTKIISALTGFGCLAILVFLHRRSYHSRRLIHMLKNGCEIRCLNDNSKPTVWVDGKVYRDSKWTKAAIQLLDRKIAYISTGTNRLVLAKAPSNNSKASNTANQ